MAIKEKELARYWIRHARADRQSRRDAELLSLDEGIPSPCDL
jgi:hypothetical protein